MTWDPDSWPGLGWWLYALKAKEAPPFWREPAVWALEQFARPPNARLIPVPSARPRNHARGFAREIARWSGWPVVEALSATGGTRAAQKQLSRGARRGRRFVRSCETLPRDASLILVDDVITSGATAEAAFRALGRPANFRVWCLADRRPCGHPGALL